MPDFRRRMAKRVAPELWLYPNINTGCVIKFDDQGRIVDSLWDLGGVSNNRIGRYKIPGADPNWTGQDDYWGQAQ